MIGGDWATSDFVTLLTSLEQVYDVFMVLRLDVQSKTGDLRLIASRLRQLAPESQLGIAAIQFASDGVISLRGSGELAHELRGFVTDLATIDQRRAANKLDLERKKHELAEREAALQRQRELDEIERERLIQQHKLELAQTQQQIMRTDLEIGSQYLSLIRQRFEDQYGPNWRDVPGTTEQFELFSRQRKRAPTSA